MALKTGLDSPRSQMNTRFWQIAFVILVLGVLGIVYFASSSVEYTWRWYRVPQYFYFQDDVQVDAEIEGTVETITSTEKGPVVVLEGLSGETERYPVPGGEVLIYEGDYIYPGDTLGTYQEGKPGILLQGLWITLKVSVVAIILGIVLGVLTGLSRISSNPALRWSAITYIEIIRGSPLLVQIFLWYFVIGTLVNSILAQNGLGQISPLWFGIISLAVFTGAYVAEIVRAGIQSVSRGQMEAARSLGMTYTQSMRKVILPQAFKRILPALAGQFISLIMDSSLLGVISVRELTKATREVVTSSLQPFELWITCAVLYLLLTFTLSLVVQYIERKAV